ncbi:MAG: hypothetical protein RLZZ121_445 [Bacteroidota bacterium]
MTRVKRERRGDAAVKRGGAKPKTTLKFNHKERGRPEALLGSKFDQP